MRSPLRHPRADLLGAPPVPGGTDSTDSTGGTDSADGTGGTGSTARRRRRTVALLVAGGALLLGTWRGTDHAFPFGPFSMYAGGGPRSGVVDSTTLQAVTATGRQVPVPDTVSGMRRAELEGRLPQFLARPALLGDVATAHARARPAEPPYVQVQVVRRRYEVRHRRVVGSTDVVLARWSAP